MHPLQPNPPLQPIRPKKYDFLRNRGAASPELSPQSLYSLQRPEAGEPGDFDD